MNKLNVVVIGAGLYVCGRGTSGYGTILPAIFEWKRDKNLLGEIYCVSTSQGSSKEILKKASELSTKTGIDLKILSSPNKKDDNLAYQKIIRKLKKPACAIIAVPDHLHYQITKDCLEAGLHCLLVKPFTPTSLEGSKLIKLADKKELYGAVEFHKRWDKSNLILKDKFQNGELGLPINCWVEYSQRKSVPVQFFKTWASKTSILQYLGVHYIDIIRFITGAIPKRVMAIGQKTEIIQFDIDSYDSIQCVVEWKMKDGTKFTETILTNWIDPETSSAVSDQKIKFIGSKGRYEADQKERGIRVNTNEDGIEHINPDFCRPFGTGDGNIKWEGYGIQSVKTFLSDVLALEMKQHSLQDLEMIRPSFKESLVSTAVIEAAHHSLQNGSEWENIELGFDNTNDFS